LYQGITERLIARERSRTGAVARSGSRWSLTGEVATAISTLERHDQASLCDA